jgi:hypothetical protein
MTSPVSPVDSAPPVSRVGGTEARFVLQDSPTKGSAETKRVIVKIVTDTNPPEVVRQIPPEEYLNFVTQAEQAISALQAQQAQLGSVTGA